MTRALSNFQHSALFTRLSPPQNVNLLEDRFEELFNIHPVSPLLCVTVGDFSNSPTLLSVDTAAIPTPLSYSEAVSGFHATEWMTAIIAECEAFTRTNSYIDSVPPPGATIVKGKWVFRVKQLPGELPVFKARYCAKGFTQREGIDYFATYSPTARLPTLRLLLDLGARWNWEIHSMDVSNAFLQGELHERIFLERPAGFPRPFPPGTVWELKRPVYGLKQAPREWHAKLASTLHSLGFSTSTSDPSLFIRTSPHRLYILAYVDDLVLLAEDSADLAAVKKALQARLMCKDLGELRHYLGMEIRRDRAARTISLSQSFYIQSILQRFEMSQAKPVSTPLPANHQLTAPAVPAPSSELRPYPELVGSLMYAMMCTRPDLAYPLSVLSRFVGLGRHTDVHWAAAKRVLRYLRATSDLALTLGGSIPPVLSGYSDSSYADSRPDRRSSQGYGFTLGSGLISWRSTRSSSVCLSTCEAELYAGTLAAQEARWLSFLLAELGHSQSSVTLSCDSASMIHLTENPVYHARSKHIEVRYFFVRELVQSGFLRLRKVDATANLADIFTKALLRAPHRFYVRELGLTRLSTSGGVPVR
ncbi:unnamed protein product [Closterium sp. Yama58-4]|nr:unnamed protein product [Closterium sp. Yama58-4]